MVLRLKQVNEQYINRIIIQKQQEKIDKEASEAAESAIKQSELEAEARERAIKIIERYKLNVDLTNKSLYEQKVAIKEALGVLEKGTRSYSIMKVQ